MYYFSIDELKDLCKINRNHVSGLMNNIKEYEDRYNNERNIETKESLKTRIIDAKEFVNELMFQTEEIQEYLGEISHRGHCKWIAIDLENNHSLPPIGEEVAWTIKKDEKYVKFFGKLSSDNTILLNDGELNLTKGFLWQRIVEPYEPKQYTYDKEYGDERICICSHKYIEHFDEDGNMKRCKKCKCGHFFEKVLNVVSIN